MDSVRQNSADRYRALCVQPALPKYRVPVFRELANRQELQATLWYGDHDGVKNVPPEGFHAELKPMRWWSIAGQEARWHQAQIDAVQRDDVDVVQLSWGTRYLSLGPALRSAKQRDVPVVLWGHGFSRSESMLRRWMRDRIGKLADALLFYDAQTARNAVESGWPEDRVFVAPNAIDQQPIQNAREHWLSRPADRDGFRQEHQLGDRRLLLYVSQFRPENRLPLLIEAIDQLRKRRPEVVLAMVGGGELHEAITADVARRGLQEHVRLLGPIYDEQQLAPWFLSAEMFVYPAAIGLSLLHAFGYGLPVVTDDARASHNPEIVAFNPDLESPDANGLEYRAGDAADLAATIERLLDDQDLRNRLGHQAQQTVEDRYNVPAMVDGMVAAFRRCLA